MKRVLLALALATVPACLEPSLTPCGDLLCAEGSVCVDNIVCASREQLEACGGLTEKDPCQGPLGPGYCSTGVCVANVCGDGRVTGNESCDGNETTVMCASFGFYEGTTTCTAACVPEPGTCTGKCGDEMVQSEFGEQCDGAPPAESCLEFGRDYGVLSCNAFCAPAITTDCQRYGWEQLLPATVTYLHAAANAHGAVGVRAGTIDVVWNGTASTRANTAGWTRAAANKDMLVVTGPSSSAWFDGQWHDLSAGIAATWLTASDDGVMFGRVGSSGCVIERVVLADAEKTTVPAPAQACAHGVALASNRLYVAQAVDGVRMWDGANWTVTIGGSVTTLAQAGPQKLAALGPSTLRLVDVSTLTPTITTRIGAAVVGTEAFDDDGNQLRASSSGDSGQLVFDVRAHDLLAELPDLIEDAQVALGRTADGRLLTYGLGVRAMRPLLFRREIPSTPTINALVRAGNGLIACGSEVVVTGLGGLVGRPYNAGAAGHCIAATGDSTGAHFVLSTNDGVYRYNAGNNTYETLSLSPGPDYTDIAGDFLQMYIATSSYVLSSTAGAAVAIEPAPQTCQIMKLAMSPNRKFVGVGTCNNTLAVFERTTAWQTMLTATTPIIGLSQLEIAIGTDDTIIIRHGADVFRVDGNTLTKIGTGEGIDIVTRDDIFIDQGGDEMLHITPTTTQSMRLPSGPFFASSTHVFAWERSARRIVGVARVTGQAGGP